MIAMCVIRQEKSRPEAALETSKAASLVGALGKPAAAHAMGHAVRPPGSRHQEIEMPATLTPGMVCEFGFRGKATRFFVRNLMDIIQNAHLNGAFYEEEHLAVIERHLKPGGVFLDVGANVGNHAIYVAKHCDPGAVIVIEPNPQALVLLRLNLLLNRLDLDTSHLGVGLSDQERKAEPSTPPNNLGGTKMVLKDDGPLKLVAGDSLFAGRRIDFIKIDVEGQEIAVLAGLEQTIAASRPPMFIEVDNENERAFQTWLADHDYEVAFAFPRYRNQNFVVRPKEAPAQ
ncbi:MAG: FkbM family methyltransferase [Phenylobacterium sp.]|nr:MAG: FkbM family methyltransferase [Phenylobacterium sp.]